jgi:adenylate cyclase
MMSSLCLISVLNDYASRNLPVTLRFSDLLLGQWRTAKGTPKKQWYWAILISIVVTTLMTLLNSTGLFQTLEWAFLDSYFRIRPHEAIDSRLLVVTIDEPDIANLQRWPLTDQDLVEALRILQQYSPAVIGLDIYRDFSVPPGKDALDEIFTTATDVIGVEKVSRTQVAPPPILDAKNQVGMADLVLDEDGKVRRALIMANLEGEYKTSLGAFLAIEYLMQQGLTFEADGNSDLVKFGEATFRRLNPASGGYVDADVKGYQILLNFRGPDNAFDTLTLSNLLTGNFDEDLIRDRIVLIGSIAPSINDFMRTPFNQSEVTENGLSPGVLIHAHITSQIISSVLDRRANIKFIPNSLEFLWALAWACIGSIVIIIPLHYNRSFMTIFSRTSLPIIGLSFGLIGVTMVLFLNNIWLPVIPALSSLLLSAVCGLAQHNSSLLQYAYIDGLTGLSNRRYFNQRLADFQDEKGDICIILCDVDNFKQFNDFYGHPVGDICLQKVGVAIQQSVRRQDVVSRYGGEEFAVILHNATSDLALEIAERMRRNVQACKIPHQKSAVHDYVTISCGVATRPSSNSELMAKLLVSADKALYQAKRSGRDQVFLITGKD